MLFPKQEGLLHLHYTYTHQITYLPFCVRQVSCIYRNSYLPLHMSTVVSYFSQYIKPELTGSPAWCDSDSRKIKWHIPVGATYDMLFGLRGQGQVWNVTVHFSDYPEKELLRCLSVDCVKAHFMSTLKEADSLKHNSVSIEII